jgi:hypothetical protein
MISRLGELDQGAVFWNAVTSVARHRFDISPFINEKTPSPEILPALFKAFTPPSPQYASRAINPPSFAFC